MIERVNDLKWVHDVGMRALFLFKMIDDRLAVQNCQSVTPIHNHYAVLTQIVIIMPFCQSGVYNRSMVCTAHHE